MRGLVVRATGPQALVQDLGRPGHAATGVTVAGAADRASLRRGNRAVGNDEGAAAVEVVLGGLEVEVGDEVLWLCVTGAPCTVRVDGRGVGSHAPFAAPPGSRVRLGVPATGLRSYLCVRGGLVVPAVLGSRSTDVLSGVGPAPLAEGATLAVGRATGGFPGVDHWPHPPVEDLVVLRAVRGPRDDWCADADALVRGRWRAGDRSNRVGVRLERDEGPALSLARDDELPSEGVRRGAVQVPPSGEPVLFLADHPVTGGYPVVGVVVDADVDRAAQLRPGQGVGFRWVPAP